MDTDIQYAIEKFTRCPRCRSFSLKGLNQDETDMTPGGLSGSIFVCNNCGNQYALQGNSLKEITNLVPERKQETKTKEPVKVESKTISRAAVFLVPILCLIIVGVILLSNPWNQGREQIEAPQLQLQSKVEKKTTPVKAMEVVNKNERKGENLAAAVIKEIEEANEEPQRIGPISHKIFDTSWLKVRKTSPGYSDKSFRWYFKRKTITIKRSKTQRVYIAGDPTGKKKWAVDDEIIINGERIKSFSREMTKIGYIPESTQVPPYDITPLVPADRETVLDIRLVDYGVVWGNTSLYIVIM